MECINVKELLNAWIDHELPDDLSEQVTRHIVECQSCRDEATALSRVSEALNTMPPVVAPTRLTRKTLKAFRTSFHQPGFWEWWHNISFSMRIAACGIAVAGLLFGIILGDSLPLILIKTTTNTYFDSLYLMEGILL